MTDSTPAVWIDILSDPAVRLAARAWHKDLPETWGILSRAINAEDVSQHMPLYEFQVLIKLTVDPLFFGHCPVCQTTTSTTASICANCHVDLEIARKASIETEFKNYSVILDGTAAPHVVSTPTKPTPPHKPSQLATSLLWLGRFIYIVGGILAMLYSLYVVGFLFGWVNALVALILFPFTYALLPFYTLFMFGDLTLLVANYGVGITAFALSYIAHRIDPNIE